MSATPLLQVADFKHGSVWKMMVIWLSCAQTLCSSCTEAGCYRAVGIWVFISAPVHAAGHQL